MGSGPVVSLVCDTHSQVICWDRGRPARNAPKARGFQAAVSLFIFALRAHCGRDARGPSKSLDWLNVLQVSRKAS